jgi:hypothetical protein
MKRSQTVVLISLLCVLAVLALSGLGRFHADGWTWDEPALSANSAPDGWTWDEPAVESGPGATTDGWTWDEQS